MTSLPNSQQSNLIASPQKRTGSVRTLLIALTLIPPLLTGGVNAITQFEREPNRQRSILLEGITYATQTFAVSTANLMENEGKSLNDKRLRVQLQTRAEHLIHHSKTNTFPIRDILMTNQEGIIMMASSAQFKYGSASIRGDWQKAWRKQNPKLAQAVTEAARYAHIKDTSTTTAIQNSNVLISAVPLAGPSGVAVMIIDDHALNNIAQEGIGSQLLWTLIMALISGLVALIIASHLAQRIMNLTAEARRIGEARTIAELDKPVQITGNDELSILGRNLDRLRAGIRATLQFQLNKRHHQ